MNSGENEVDFWQYLYTALVIVVIIGCFYCVFALFSYSLENKLTDWASIIISIAMNYIFLKSRKCDINFLRRGLMIAIPIVYIGLFAFLFKGHSLMMAFYALCLINMIRIPWKQNFR